MFYPPLHGNAKQLHLTAALVLRPRKASLSNFSKVLLFQASSQDLVVQGLTYGPRGHSSRSAELAHCYIVYNSPSSRAYLPQRMDGKDPLAITGFSPGLNTILFGNLFLLTYLVITLREIYQAAHGNKQCTKYYTYACFQYHSFSSLY